MAPCIAYLSQGKLLLKAEDQPARTIESEFGQDVQQRMLQIQRKNAWKDRGIRSLTMPASMLKQLEAAAEAAPPVAITSLCRGEVGQIFYALEAAQVGGLFQYDLERNRETRLFHNSEFRVGDLDFSPQHRLIACIKTYPTGISNLATMAMDGMRPLDVTEGDSIDLAPRWVAGETKALVYQSAGVSRNSEGYVLARAPFTIEKLDFSQQTVTTLADDPKSDLLGPQIGPDGQLYYIRRPYKRMGQSVDLVQFLKDLLLIPLRLAHAIFQFLSVFTQSFTGKPLITAGTNQPVERKFIRAWGDWISPENLPKRHAGDGDAPGLVPRTWQLVRQGQTGTPEVLADGVLTYTVQTDGQVVYTNGSGIYSLKSGGERQRLHVDRWIESVVLL